jgi:hypothetical protein
MISLSLTSGARYHNLMKKFLFCALLAWSGCSTPGYKMNELELGMSKLQVIKIMGHPVTTKATSGAEVLEYRVWDGGFGTESTHWLVMREGKLIQWGRAGDFDTTAPPTLVIQHK